MFKTVLNIRFKTVCSKRYNSDAVRIVFEVFTRSLKQELHRFTAYSGFYFSYLGLICEAVGEGANIIFQTDPRADF